MTFSIFRYFGVAGLFIAVDYPTGVVPLGTGPAKRYFRLGLLEFPFTLLACFIGIQLGRRRCCNGNCSLHSIPFIPFLYLVFRGTEVSLRDIWKAVARFPASAVTAGVAGYFVNLGLSEHLGPLARLCIGSSASVGVYAAMLLAGFGRWAALLSVGRAFLNQRSSVRAGAVSA